MFGNLPGGVQNGTPLGKFDSLQQFRAQVHSPKTIADVFPTGFILTPLCPDLDQAIREPKSADLTSVCLNSPREEVYLLKWFLH